MLLTAAYRSLSRPSSAPDAKAFTLCSSSLELPAVSSTAHLVLVFELLESHKQIFLVINSSAVKRFDPFYVLSNCFHLSVKL